LIHGPAQDVRSGKHVLDPNICRASCGLSNMFFFEIVKYVLMHLPRTSGACGPNFYLVRLSVTELVMRVSSV
jgi:hypothetical protein